ncbi:hypothetical protein F5144DRAFT_580516 [Chaetomium tenue]|uniref:Uncharacterized protein n=1 Tax=Chaetomium tenue TaxID=1854479 RepID=A0ACB7P9E5_9PEZI|nr:hypothetical protein F5144DRAFT_580516 [Chaetomium globosum]
MSVNEEIAHLRRQLEAAKAREEHERREKEHERRAKEHERRENERLRLETRETTLLEYLHNCHSHLYNSLRLADASMSSTGFTRVLGKFYPKRLHLWTQFTDVLHPHYFDLVQKICGQSQLFEPANITKNLGTIISDDLAGNEKAIDRFEVDAVERPVRRILKVLATHQELGREYHQCGDFRFSSNLLELTQSSDGSGVADDETGAESPQRRRRAGPNKRLASEWRYERPRTKPDGIGLRSRPGGGESLALVYDYKAAHKIAIEHLRSALAKEHLFLEVVARIDGATSSSNTEVQDREKAEASVAMALTQVFDYMITYGVSYGYVTAGRSLLLLFVDRNDLQTLYCHPCIPGDDVEELTSDWANRLSRTAVAQLVSFCLLSLQSDALEGTSLETVLSRAQATLQTWPKPYGDAASFGYEPAASSSAPSSQASDDSEFISNAKPAGPGVGLRSRSSCKPAGVLPQGDEDDEEDEEGHSARDASRSSNKRKRGPLISSEDEDVAMVDSAPTRQYCTQGCLLGLKRGRDLDMNCPNVSIHRSDGFSRHPIDADQFTDLVNRQLLRDPYQKCQTVDVWGKRGAIGWLFKLELSPYGYTFVGKGTLEGRLDRLEHEGQVYARLDHLQGEVIPVHLGLVHLDPGYIIPGARFVVHMILMSWAGERPGVGVDDAKTLKKESLTAIWRHGVDQGDDCSANYLWNAERRRIMIIDFDRARLLPLPEAQAVSKLKRKRRGNSVADTRKRRAPDLGTQFAFDATVPHC